MDAWERVTRIVESWPTIISLGCAALFALAVKSGIL